MFCISNFMVRVTDSVDWPYSVVVSPARRNFLIIATILIPSCWLLAHLLVWIHHQVLDVGAATCGANFHFGKGFFCENDF